MTFHSPSDFVFAGANHQDGQWEDSGKKKEAMQKLCFPFCYYCKHKPNINRKHQNGNMMKSTMLNYFLNNNKPKIGY
jgi:hypothetical protein